MERLENKWLENERIENENIKREENDQETLDNDMIQRIRQKHEIILKFNKMQQEKPLKNIESDFEEQMQRVDEIISWAANLGQNISKLPSSFKIFRDSLPSKEKIIDEKEEISNTIINSKSSKFCFRRIRIHKIFRTLNKNFISLLFILLKRPNSNCKK